MTFQKLISICEPVDVYGSEPKQIGKLTQDSRVAEQNGVFIAIKGDRSDGHNFIGDAVEKGASVVVCEEIPEKKNNVCFIQVADTRSLLGPLAQAFEGNPAEVLNIVGITGTNGKTTTVTLTYQALQKMGSNVSLLGTVEKRINKETVESTLTTADPIELAADMRKMVNAGSTYLVMEVSSHALLQKRVEGIGFDVGAFTNLSHDHLDYHESMDEYAAAKKRLFDGLDATAAAVVNGDDAYADYMISDCEADITQFNFDASDGKRDINCKILSSDTDGLKIEAGEAEIKSPLVGRFNAYNVVQSFFICRALGYEGEKITEALAQSKGAPGRLERIEIENAQNKPAVLVDYAHTPGALENVLQTLAGFKKEDQTLHAVFGCGGDRDKTKRPKMAEAAERYADQVTVTSDNPRSEDPDAIIDDAMKGFGRPDKVIRITDRREAIIKAVTSGDASTVILIAGKGHETYQEVRGVRHHFDDREVAREALGRSNGNPKPKEVT